MGCCKKKSIAKCNLHFFFAICSWVVFLQIAIRCSNKNIEFLGDPKMIVFTWFWAFPGFVHILFDTADVSIQKIFSKIKKNKKNT